MKNLIILSIAGNKTSDTGATFFTSSKYMRNLRLLYISGNEIRNAGATVIREKFPYLSKIL